MKTQLYDRNMVKTIFKRLAQQGTAPEEGCELFGVGYEDAFNRLIHEYVEDSFSTGSSAEKFVIGPYGSGKSHFLRHFMALCRKCNCVTADIQLNKSIDYTKPLVVYKELAKKIKPPDSDSPGIKELVNNAIETVRNRVPGQANPISFVNSWIDGIAEQDFKDQHFAEVMQCALRAQLGEDKDTFTTTVHWLSGEIDNRNLIKDMPSDLHLKAVPKSEQGKRAQEMTLSLCQFCRRSGYTGTIICYDEAEQGFNVSKSKQQVILSMLQSEINSIADLQGGSVLLMFAVTPDIAEHFDRFQALQQRTSDPGPNMTFFDHNTLAPKIDLTVRQDPVEELRIIGGKLVDLFFEHFGDEVDVDGETANERMLAEVSSILEIEAESSNRRTLVRRVSTYLASLLSNNSGMQSNFETAENEA